LSIVDGLLVVLFGVEFAWMVLFSFFVVVTCQDCAMRYGGQRYILNDGNI